MPVLRRDFIAGDSVIIDAAPHKPCVHIGVQTAVNCGQRKPWESAANLGMYLLCCQRRLRRAHRGKDRPALRRLPLHTTTAFYAVSSSCQPLHTSIQHLLAESAASSSQESSIALLELPAAGNMVLNR